MTPSLLSSAVIVNVDDHEGARYARTRILQQAGFSVHDAGTGHDALRLIAECQPDIVLLDVHLPDVSGIEICRLLKSQPEAVIVLQISASAISAPQATVALNTGADAYLIEPVDPDVLVATVRAFLRLRAAERALAKANRELSEKNTELHQVNQALRRSNGDLEHFAYIASHDLQEPLRNITTHIRLLERNMDSRFSESERSLFDVVAEGAQRMSTLIHDVLAYSRIGKEVPVLKPTRLDEAMAIALHNLTDMIEASGAAVNAGELPVVTGDCTQLSQVFQNLIGNSIKYRKTGVPVVVNIQAASGSKSDWVVRVCDNGIGIAEEYLETVFQPFKRLHGYAIPGNGIGLALCARIIEGHGGRIWVESRPGEGATFCFTLHPAGSALPD
jgi:signal transduction histidine kinase